MKKQEINLKGAKVRYTKPGTTQWICIGKITLPDGTVFQKVNPHRFLKAGTTVYTLFSNGLGDDDGLRAETIHQWNTALSGPRVGNKTRPYLRGYENLGGILGGRDVMFIRIKSPIANEVK